MPLNRTKKSQNVLKNPFLLLIAMRKYLAAKCPNAVTHIIGAFIARSGSTIF